MAGVRCKWSWSWLKLEAALDIKGAEYIFPLSDFLKKKKKRLTHQDVLNAFFVLKLSTTVVRAHMPFWLTVKQIAISRESTFYQVAVLV